MHGAQWDRTISCKRLSRHQTYTRPSTGHNANIKSFTENSFSTFGSAVCIMVNYTIKAHWNRENGYQYAKSKQDGILKLWYLRWLFKTWFRKHDRPMTSSRLPDWLDASFKRVWRNWCRTGLAKQTRVYGKNICSAYINLTLLPKRPPQHPHKLQHTQITLHTSYSHRRSRHGWHRM